MGDVVSNSSPFTRPGLRFKHHLRVASVGPDLVFLLGEREQFMLRGTVYGLLAPLLDGTRGPEALVSELCGVASPADVHYALTTLRERGYLVAGEPSMPSEAAAFWQSAGIDPDVAQARLQATPVAVVAVGGLSPRFFIEALEGVGLTLDADRAGVRFVLTEDYLSHELELLNQTALER